jgi:uncharacterized protein with GYD domain
MAPYLYQASCMSEAVAAQVREPTGPDQAVRPVIEAMGGKLVAAGYPFGEYDAVILFEAPEETTAAAFALAVAAGGAARSAKTTRLLSGQEWIESLQKAQGSQYRPPQQQLPGFPGLDCGRSWYRQLLQLFYIPQLTRPGPVSKRANDERTSCPLRAPARSSALTITGHPVTKIAVRLQAEPDDRCSIGGKPGSRRRPDLPVEHAGLAHNDALPHVLTYIGGKAL